MKVFEVVAYIKTDLSKVEFEKLLHKLMIVNNIKIRTQINELDSRIWMEDDE